jgi:hypothetical protein
MFPSTRVSVDSFPLAQFPRNDISSKMPYELDRAISKELQNPNIEKDDTQLLTKESIGKINSKRVEIIKNKNITNICLSTAPALMIAGIVAFALCIFAPIPLLIIGSVLVATSLAVWGTAIDQNIRMNQKIGELASQLIPIRHQIALAQRFKKDGRTHLEFLEQIPRSDLKLLSNAARHIGSAKEEHLVSILRIAQEKSAIMNRYPSFAWPAFQQACRTLYSTHPQKGLKLFSNFLDLLNEKNPDPNFSLESNYLPLFTRLHDDICTPYNTNEKVENFEKFFVHFRDDFLKDDLSLKNVYHHLGNLEFGMTIEESFEIHNLLEQAFNSLSPAKKEQKIYECESAVKSALGKYPNLKEEIWTQIRAFCQNPPTAQGPNFISQEDRFVLFFKQAILQPTLPRLP